MLCEKKVLSETETRYMARKTEREKGEQQIRAGNILQANSLERVQARLNRLGIDKRFAEAVSVERTIPPTARKPHTFGLSGNRRTEVLTPTARGIGAIAPQPSMASPSLFPPGENINNILLERIIGRNDLLGISYMDLGLRTSRSVGCVRLFQNGRPMGAGTGFLVSPRLLLTNNHVLSSVARGREARVVFNFQDDPDGNALPTVTFTLDPDSFFLTSTGLDYSLVAVSQRSREGRELEEFGWTRLIEDEGKVINGEYVTIIQHPNGHPKQIALRENQVIDLLDEFIHYHTDTAPGSSGSPVFNDQWEVVSLHHSGVPKRDSEGRILTRKNTLWMDGMDDSEIQWIANEGVRISRVLKHVKDQTLGQTARQLRDQLFEAEPVRPSEPERPTLVPGGSSAGHQSVSLSSATPQTDKGVATWTIPLRISIQVGDILPPAESPRTTLRKDTDNQSRIAVPLPAQDADAELRSYLEEARRARTRTYYDKPADTKDQKAYYASVATSVSPTKFFKKLADLVTSTHSIKPTYKPGKELYPWIDLRPNRKLRSIYSGLEFTPEELIREDFRIDLERTTRLREIALRETSLTAARFQEELDLLEASLPYNCEHVVPQSWFGKKEPMRGDLHHLFACESGCNSFRGNTPYYDFPDFEEVVRDKCGKRVENKFEPGGGKGPVARATMYFLLRYPGQINQTTKEYTKDRIETLLQWHLDFPVDEYEKHRNMAIFQRQGNRNPLIDHPEWAKRINFGLGLG